jgi:hypothetical protein
MGVPPKGGGGPGRFPLAPGSRCRFVVVPSAATIALKCLPMVDKKFQVGCISTIITKHRSDRRAADPSAIVSNLSFVLPTVAPASPNERLWLQLGDKLWSFRRRAVGSNLVDVQVACLATSIPFRQFSGHSITTGSSLSSGRLTTCQFLGHSPPPMTRRKQRVGFVGFVGTFRRAFVEQLVR